MKFELTNPEVMLILAIRKMNDFDSVTVTKQKCSSVQAFKADFKSSIFIQRVIDDKTIREYSEGAE